MKLLVVGASGLVGGDLSRRARQLGHVVIGAARQISGDAVVSIDLTDRGATDDAIGRIQPDVVAICSAWPWVDGCEQDPERSHRENVGAVYNVIRATAGAPTRLVYYSTDQIFDGNQMFNVESDVVQPCNVYARHKRESEELLLSDGRALVVRTAWVFGAEAKQKNFMYQVIRASRTGQTLRLPAEQAGCPTWSRWLTSSTLGLLGEGVQGVVHLTGGSLLTKAEWARLLIAELQLGQPPIVEVPAEVSGQVAPRPHRVALRSERHAFVQPPLSEILRANRASLLDS